MSRRSWHQPRRDGYAVICEHCDHVHLGAPGEACHNSEHRSHLCGCTGTPETGTLNLCERSDTMGKGNGKDGFTEIAGKRPKGKANTEADA